MSTVSELRKNGHKVRVTHYRCYEGVYIPSRRRRDIAYNLMTKDEFQKYHAKTYSDYVLPFGGETVVEVMINGKDYVGVATCSVNDNYNKKSGTALALERALKSYEQSGK